MSIVHWLVVLLVILVVFGAAGKGKIPSIMEDLGKGIRGFKDGLKGDEAKGKQEILPPSDNKKGE